MVIGRPYNNRLQLTQFRMTDSAPLNMDAIDDVPNTNLTTGNSGYVENMINQAQPIISNQDQAAQAVVNTGHQLNR